VVLGTALLHSRLQLAASIHFSVHRPAELPAGLHESSVEARDNRLPYLVSHSSGRAVFTGPSTGTVDGRDAFALFDGTLVRFVSVGLSERDVLAWFDSPRSVELEDVDFKG
jgi:hypothetical protein